MRNTKLKGSVVLLAVALFVTVLVLVSLNYKRPVVNEVPTAVEQQPIPVEKAQKAAIRDDGSFKKTESFEGGQIPTAWQTEGGGQLSLSEAHY